MPPVALNSVTIFKVDQVDICLSCQEFDVSLNIFFVNWIGQLYCFVLMTFKENSPLFKTLLEGCCSDEILYINENGQFLLDTDSTAVIQDVQLLEKLLLDWKIWSKAKVITFILEGF